MLCCGEGKGSDVRPNKCLAQEWYFFMISQLVAGFRGVGVAVTNFDTAQTTAAKCSNDKSRKHCFFGVEV